jgi:hypothetical protein
VLTPAERFLQATEALMLTVVLNERLKNPESVIALVKARDHFVDVATTFVPGWANPRPLE